MLKRKYLIIIAFALIIIGITIPKCFADDEIPVIEESSITVNNSNVTMDEQIKISMRIAGADNYETIQLWYQMPITQKKENRGYLQYNSNTGLYECTFTIDENYESGIWKIDRIAFKIKNTLNWIMIYNSKTNTTGSNLQNLERGNFTVYGTDADTTPPSINIDSLHVSPKKAEFGEKITISIRITDDRELLTNYGVAIVYKKMQTGETERLNLNYNSEEDIFEKTITINESVETGIWKIYYIYAQDKASNSILLYNSNVNTFGNMADLSAGDFTIIADSDEFKAELATITELEGIQVYTENTAVSNTTINGDVYIGPQAIVTLRNVTVNGDIYVLGGLKLSSVNANAVHAKTMQWSSSGGYSYTNGMFTISGSNTISSTECSNYPVTYIPYKLNRDSINITDGKLHINGITLDIADFYINNTKINTARGGKFIADNIDLGGSNIITLKWVTVFGNTITKTYCIEDIVGDVNFDGKVNITDVALINAHVKKTKTLTGDELERADVNGDGKVNITDVALVNAYVKKVKPLPTPKTDKEKAEDIINKYLNNGTLEANAIRPNSNNQAEIETFYYSSIYDDFIDLDELKNDLSNQNMSLQFSHDNIPSDYSSFTIKVYKTENGQTTDEITEMTIPINYKTVDQNVLDKSENLIQKIKTNGVIPEGWDVDEYYGFYLEDLELVNYYTSCGITKDTVRTKEQTGKSLNYLDCLATNDNEMSYYLDAREGDDYLLNEDYGGFANILYNGIKVGAIDLVGVIEKNVIHIPAETENTKEAYIEAATQKLKEKFGDNVSVTEAGLRSSLDLSSAIENGWSWSRLGDESLMGDYYYNVTVNGYTNQFIIIRESNNSLDNYLMLAEEETEYFFGNTNIKKESIEKVILTDSIDGHSINDDNCWDISSKQNASILAWYEDIDSDNLYEVTIGQKNGVEANPDSSYLFNGLTNCESILNLSLLKTGNVNNMKAMFCCCYALKELDLNNFDTKEVTNMRLMFGYAESLRSLDLSSFNTSKVTDMSGMFFQCFSLETINLSSFETEKVTNMDSMFWACESLKELDVSKFDTSNVVDMSSMFGGCSTLEILNLESFNTSKVEEMDGMFMDMSEGSKLKTILVSNKFNTSKVSDSEIMFEGCYSLVGGAGTVYNPNYTDKTYAIIDKGETSPGYFTLKDWNIDTNNDGIPDINIDIDNDFIADINIDTDGDNIADANIDIDNDGIADQNFLNHLVQETEYAVTFLGNDKINRENIEKITLIESIEGHSSDDENCWDVSSNFNGSILAWYEDTDFDNLYEVKIGQKGGVAANPDSSYLFYRLYNCKEIENIDKLKTGDVTNMHCMFYDCRAVESLDLSSFKTAKVTDMSYMFCSCYELTNLNVQNFNTENVSDMSGMFSDCRKISVLNVSNFNTQKVTSMKSMFMDCYLLTEIDLSKFDTSNVTTMESMFFACSKLSELNLCNFNTQKVTNMHSMFSIDSNLTELDLSSFDTSNVTNMKSMFKACRNLKTIYVSEIFVSSTPTNCEDMFDNCKSIVGGEGTTYEHYTNNLSLDYKYAHIDEGTSNPGFFTRKE